MPSEEIEYEYASRSYDGLNGERIAIKPTLAEAQAHVDHLHRISGTRSTYGIRAEVVIRPEGNTGWTALTAEQVKEIQEEAWGALDAAMSPVLAAAFERHANR